MPTRGSRCRLRASQSVTQGPCRSVRIMQAWQRRCAKDTNVSPEPPQKPYSLPRPASISSTLAPASSSYPSMPYVSVRYTGHVAPESALRTFDWSAPREKRTSASIATLVRSGRSRPASASPAPGTRKVCRRMRRGAASVGELGRESAARSAYRGDFRRDRSWPDRAQRRAGVVYPGCTKPLCEQGRGPPTLTASRKALSAADSGPKILSASSGADTSCSARGISRGSGSSMRYDALPSARPPPRREGELDGTWHNFLPAAHRASAVWASKLASGPARRAHARQGAGAPA